MLKLARGARFGVLYSLFVCCLLLLASAVRADVSQVPFVSSTSAKPKMMLLMSKDHELFKKAYSDYSDLNGDGKLDTTYDNTIEYDGYFNNTLCYQYGSNNVFSATGQASNHLCSGQWSGNFLNWATMTRMDLVRKVLYGGKRWGTLGGYTILKSAWLPSDIHSFVKVYEGTASVPVSSVTPFDYPKLSMCNNSYSNLTTKNYVLARDNPRGMLLARGSWPFWATDEIYQCGVNGDGISPSGDEYLGGMNLLVQVCDEIDSRPETECKTYTNPNSKRKPVGLLQNYGETDQIDFGLITGTYYRNDQGGALRKQISSFMGAEREVNPSNGDFLYPEHSIIKVIDSLQIVRYSGPGDTQDTYFRYIGCGVDDPVSSCESWGNPLSEMYAEALRYLTINAETKRTPTSNFLSGTHDEDVLDMDGWFGDVDWGENPWGEDAKCSSCTILILSSGENSFDMDNLNLADIPSLTLSKLKGYVNNTISTAEGIKGNTFLVSTNDGTNAKCQTEQVNYLYDVRGICPDGAANEGGYALAGLAYHAYHTDFHNNDMGIKTYGVALSEALPVYTFKTTSGNITVIPNCTSRDGAAYCSMIDVRVAEQVVDGSGNLRKLRIMIGWEDSPWGSDYDMDMISEMSICVGSECGDGTGEDQIEITAGVPLKTSAAHMQQGYTITGSSADGVIWMDPVTAYNQNLFTNMNQMEVDRSEHYDTRKFSGSSSKKIEPLPLPLELAAKYGGGENSLDPDGDPDNFYKVQNFSALGLNLDKVFSQVAQNTHFKAAITGSSTTQSEGGQVFYSSFDSVNSWNGHFYAYKYDAYGNLVKNWDAATQLNNIDPDNRVMLTWNDNSNSGVPFRLDNLTDWQQAQLEKRWNGSNTAINLTYALNYLRGVHLREQVNGAGNPFRSRLNQLGEPTRLGDIVHSSAAYTGDPNFYYSDTMESAPYSDFKTTYEGRTPMVYVGANDGALHGFDANTGKEKLAFVPKAVFPYLNQLMDPTYDTANKHRYFADGSPTVVDAYVNNAWRTILVSGLRAGAKSVFALDVTNPAQFSEANADSLVLWEYDDSKDTDLLNRNNNGDFIYSRLGYTFSKPAVVRLNNGRWAAVFGNGYQSDARMGVLFIVYLDAMANNTWQIGEVKRIYTNNNYSDASTAVSDDDYGISNIAPIDTDDDGNVDLIYGGDLQGNMWRFDLSDTNASNWKAVKVFQATYNNTIQPIMALPEVSLAAKTDANPNTSYLIYFGTGSYFSTEDISDDSLSQVQSFYGIKDTPSVTRNLMTNPYNLTTYSITTLSSDYRTVNQDTATGTDGWRVNLPVGEKVPEKAVLRRGQITFTTLLPAVSQCAVTETGWLMTLAAQTGGATANVFDTNGDGVVDSTDLLNGKSASGMKLDSSASALLVDKRDGEGSQTAVSVDQNGNLTQTTLANGDIYRQKRVNWQHVYPDP
ncbi:pilus assembly protein [Pokkaliibacter sp. CJK22405]|uniref:pilus assembly protein n=1 Tax=Pokkaliibacter sp. CJK22405 TaxID=3384615 RepID=UPI003984E5F2